MNHAATAPFDVRLSSFPESPWVVMKFGGTSVSTAANWANIAALLRARLAEGLRPVVVHSALAGVSNRLEELLRAAIAGEQEPLIDALYERHLELARELGVDAEAELAPHFRELRQLAAGIALVGEVSARTHARVMAAGELMSTVLGALYLNAQGLETQRLDVRELLTARESPERSERARYLSAGCDDAPDEALQQRLQGIPGILLTQGFIARSTRGDTVLLGRGGSDVSGALLAARLQARRLEIWSDVPGMFTADPRAIPTARLLRALHFHEAQEIASMGSRVLHPSCVPPVQRQGIPLYLFCTQRPDWPGTVISASAAENEAQLKAISSRTGLTLVSMETLGMWQEVGFLARAFACFAEAGVSVDLVSTSESNVTVSVDPKGQALDEVVMDRLVSQLSKICRVRVIHGCVAVSLVGRGIRAILHELGPALAVFEDHRVHMLSQAANDLNLTFVVDEDQAHRLVQKLHELMLRKYGRGKVFGPTWEELQELRKKAQQRAAPPWWERRREDLLELAQRESCAYAYDLDSVTLAAEGLKALNSVDAVFYAMKANSNPQVLQRVFELGLNFECVSPGEIERILELFPDIDRQRILFTPNFAPRSEYQYALSLGVWLTLDNLYPLRHWPELFADRDVFVRVDPGKGRGHHEHVRTAGQYSKFGVPLAELTELRELAASAQARVVGLHAHTGSGVLQPDNWRETGALLMELAQEFPDVRYLDLGGGLGVPERADAQALDLAALDDALAGLREAHPQYQLWLEPGRYLVAQAGVLLARVTQLKGKGESLYVGVATGMNSLIRPALYGAYHEIVNLSRLHEPAAEVVTVVGPICESADKLGTDRLLPLCEEGDVILVTNAGAYGYTMSSHYNLREPAPEWAI